MPTDISAEEHPVTPLLRMMKQKTLDICSLQCYNATVLIDLVQLIRCGTERSGDDNTGCTGPPSHL